MKEKLKIIVDDKNHTYVWIDGKEIKSKWTVKIYLMKIVQENF